MAYTLYFDTETTSLIPGQICQLSYILDGGTVSAKNFFFTVDSMDPGSYRVHKFGMEKLKILSGGKRFADFSEEIFWDFLNADVVAAHNFRFDYKFIAAEFERIEKRFRYKESFCTMKYFVPHCRLGGTNRNTYKYPKLSELSERFKITDAEAAGFSFDIFSDGNTTDLSDLTGTAIGLHDARYDAALMYLCVKKALKEETDLKLLDKFTV
jgi:DNA polymerase-3 subunit epsilon